MGYTLMLVGDSATAPSIPGKSKLQTVTSAFKDKCHEVLSYSLSSNQPTEQNRTEGSTTDKVFFSDFNISKTVGPGSHDFQLYTCTAKPLKWVKIEVYRQDNTDMAPSFCFLSWIMENVIISNYSISGAGTDAATESLSLNFNVINWEVKPQDPETGAMASGGGKNAWDLSTNTKPS